MVVRLLLIKLIYVHFNSKLIFSKHYNLVIILVQLRAVLGAKQSYEAKRILLVIYTVK